MLAEDNKVFIRRYLEAINGKPKTPAILELFIAEQSLKDHIAASEAAFPLYRLDPEEIVAEGDLVSVRARVRGTHRGPFMGLPPTGKEVDFAFFITYRVVGGKIVEHWMLADSLTAMQQLGAMPGPQG